jgi:tetrahydromethanopterin S-methyltransferase subunit C
VQLTKNFRNVAVILSIAAVIYVLGNTGAFALGFLETLIGLAFLAALAWIAARLYRENRVELYGLGTRRRAIAYVALGVGALALTAVNRFWSSGFGTVVWLVLLGGCVYALYAVWRSSREY